MAKSPEDSDALETRTYAKRWFMLALFVMLSMSNAGQWIQYAIISDITKAYWGVSNSFVDWTSIIYMASYVPLVLPSSWVLDKAGLRVATILAALGTCGGAWIKVLSVAPDRFWVTFVGQTIVASSQVFILSVPARLAAVWFPPGQVSSACSIGVFGNQLGIAVSFVLPTMLVKMSPSKEAIGAQFSFMFYCVASVTTVLLILILLFFRAEPEYPPSRAQASVRSVESKGFVSSIKQLMSNYGYDLLLVSYGINIGVFYAISTLLNDVVQAHFPQGSEDAGRIGLTMVLAGMLGSVMCGVALDATGKFKEVTLFVYIFSLIGMAVYSAVLSSGLIWTVYIASAILGFFMTGYLPVGFELAAELTYPEPEGTSAGILNAVVQIFGIVFTIFYRFIFERTSSSLWANMAMCATLVAGTILTALIPKDMRRQAAQKDPGSTGLTHAAEDVHDKVGETNA